MKTLLIPAFLLDFMAINKVLLSVCVRIMLTYTHAHTYAHMWGHGKNRCACMQAHINYTGVVGKLYTTSMSTHFNTLDTGWGYWPFAGHR